jgi:hypothetical protein
VDADAAASRFMALRCAVRRASNSLEVMSFISAIQRVKPKLTIGTIRPRTGGPSP